MSYSEETLQSYSEQARQEAQTYKVDAIHPTLFDAV